MRTLLFCCLVILAAACSGTKHTAGAPAQLAGTWIPVSQEMGGQLLPKSITDNQKLIIADTTYTVIAESVDKGVVHYRQNKLDIYGKEGVNAGKHFTGIYKYENGQLTICYNLLGDVYPESFDTNGKPMYFLSVFRKDTGR